MVDVRDEGIGWGRGMGSWCLWYRLSVREGEKVLEMDGGDGFTMGMYFMPLKYTLKNG